jgi:hypothetical protein
MLVPLVTAARILAVTNPTAVSARTLLACLLLLLASLAFVEKNFCQLICLEQSTVQGYMKEQQYM